MFEFDFERLDVYQLALDFITRVFRLSRKFPRDFQYTLGDQLRRAALSIANNIAEGSGKESKKEKAYFFNNSLHSARECIPMFTILHREKIVDVMVHDEFRNDCRRLTSMLVKLIKAIE